MFVSLDFIFQACMAFAIAGWIALALSPLSRAYCIAFARGVALVLAVAYLAQLIWITEPTEGGSFSTLDGIVILFSKAGNVMLGWTHYLAFDLFIGSWEAEDAPGSGVPHWLLVPCLIATLMVGPIGLLAYFVIRTVTRRMKATPAT
jgi:Domain of unknown function (DUF4281)